MPGDHEQGEEEEEGEDTRLADVKLKVKIRRESSYLIGNFNVKVFNKAKLR